MNKYGKEYCTRECAFKHKIGNLSSVWKGDEASYSAIHKYVTAKFGKPKLCVNCKTTGTRMEWANLSRKYLRNREDWIELCAGCHRKFDKSPSQKRTECIEKWSKS